MLWSVLEKTDDSFLSIPRWVTNSISRIEDPYSASGIEWHWRWVGIGSVKDMVACEESYYIRLLIPYWLIVLPITLLSAYLILWKPRKRI